jgi:hypothetical protein
MNYTIWVTFDLSKEAGLDLVNEIMHGFGFTETVAAHSRVPLYSIDTARAMTSEEMGIYRGVFEKHLMDANLPLKVFKVEIE